MANNLIMTGVTQYVNEIQDVLLGRALRTDSYEEFNKELGLYGPTRLNMAKSNAVIQDASCNFIPSGDTEISQRVIDVEHKVSDFSWCKEQWTKLKTGQEVYDNEAFPYLRKLLDGKMDAINRSIENTIWSKIETIAGADVPAGNKKTTATGATAMATVELAIANIPENVLDKAKVYVSPSLYRQLLNELMHANLFHYKVDGGNEFVYPGSEITIHKAQGLAGSSKVYALDPSNVVIGTNKEREYTMVKSKTDELTDRFDGRVEWFLGVQIAFPDEVIVVTKA